MKKRLIIIHGYRDKPDHGWMLWLKLEAEKLGYEVIAPQMPIGRVPNLNKWVKRAREVVGVLDDQTILVGHSLGTYTLLRYLAGYKGEPNEKAKSLILVAGFLQPGRASADLFFKPEPNLEKVASRVTSIYHIISNDDKSVLPEKSLELADRLGGKKIVLNNRGHFLNKNISELPELIDIIVGIDTSI